MGKGVIQKLSSFKDQTLDSQIANLTRGLSLFPFLGVLAADPTTTGWDGEDICWWVNAATPTVIVLKMWNGSSVKTFSTT